MFPAISLQYAGHTAFLHITESEPFRAFCYHRPGYEHLSRRMLKLGTDTAAIQKAPGFSECEC